MLSHSKDVLKNCSSPSRRKPSLTEKQSLTTMSEYNKSILRNHRAEKRSSTAFHVPRRDSCQQQRSTTKTNFSNNTTKAVAKQLAKERRSNYGNSKNQRLFTPTTTGDIITKFIMPELSIN